MVLDIDEVLPRPEERSRDDPGRLLVLGDESGRSDLEASSVVLGDASQIPITWVVLIDTGYLRVVSGVFQRDHLAALVDGHVVEHARTEGRAADAGGRPTAVAAKEPTPRMANNAVFLMCSPPRILGR